jgi:hypothetical protein
MMSWVLDGIMGRSWAYLVFDKQTKWLGCHCVGVVTDVENYYYWFCILQVFLLGRFYTAVLTIGDLASVVVHCQMYGRGIPLTSEFIARVGAEAAASHNSLKVQVTISTCMGNLRSNLHITPNPSDITQPC